MSGRKSSPAASASVDSPSASPSNRRRSHHHREWTHTLDSGRKEQRIHRKPNEQLDQQMQEGEDEDGENDAIEQPSASPLSAGAAAAAAQNLNPQPMSDGNDSAAKPEAATGHDDDGDVDMPDAASLESDDVEMDAEAEMSAAFAAALTEARDDPSSIQSLMHTYRSQLIAPHTSTASFESLSQLVGTLRSMLESGQEDMLDERIDENGQISTNPTASVAAALHNVRVTFAKLYPLPEQTWAEWISDVLARGSGVTPPYVRSQLTEDATEEEQQANEEANEAAEQAVAAQEQHFLISLYRLALCDYHSPSLWNSFFTYVTAVSDRLLSTEPVRNSFRKLARQAVEHEAVRVYRTKRAKEEKHLRKEEKHNAKNGKEEQKDADEEEKESDDDSDDEEEDEFSDSEEENESSEAEESDPFNPFTSLHSALLPLMPLPYSALSSDHPPSSVESLLPGPIPIGYSFFTSDANLWQKWRGVEMNVLTGMMRNMQQEQQQQSEDNHYPVASEPITQDTLESQMDLITRLYRMELKLPLANISDVWNSYKDWLAKQGESAESDQTLIRAYEQAKIWSASVKKKFETPFQALVDAGTVNSSLGVLSPEAEQLCQTFLQSQFLASSKSRKNMRSSPGAVIGWFDRLLSHAFLDKQWWKRFVDVIQELAPHHGNSHAQAPAANNESFLWHRLILDTLMRAIRNVPWSTGIARSMIHVVESLHREAGEWMTLQVVQQMFSFILTQPALQANYESGVLLRLQIVDFFKRAFILSGTSPAEIQPEHAFLVRAYLTSTRDLLPYVNTSNPSLCARFYSFWVELEYKFLYLHLGSSTDTPEQLQDLHDDAKNQAVKDGVSIATMRARQVWQDAVQLLGGTNAHVWMEYVKFELRTSEINQDQIKFVRSLFKRALESMTNAESGFDKANILCLRAIAPLLHEWLQFERVHSTHLEDVLTAERKSLPLLAALKSSESQQAAWSASGASAAAPDSAVAASAEEEEQGSWLTRPVQQRAANGGEKEKNKPKPAGGKDKPKKPQQQSKNGKPQQPKPAKQPKADASAASAAADSGATAAAPSPATNGKKNKRKRDGEGDVSVESEGEPQKKKSKSDASKPASAGAVSNDSSAAMDTSTDAPSTTSAVPPHTIFISHLAWTLKEEDHRALLGPYGTIVRLVNHRGSKAVKKPFVEVSYAKADEAQSAETALQGKMLSGKHLLVTRVSPLVEKVIEKEKSSQPDEADPLSVYLKNLPRDREDIEQVVREYFETKCGPVTSVEIPKHAPPKDPNAPVHHTSSFRNVGVVRFATPESTVKALALHMQPLCDVLIHVVPNTQPAREKRAAKEAAQKVAPVVKKATAFQPRAVATKHAPATSSPLAAASSAPISSNEDFRARLLGTKK